MERELTKEEIIAENGLTLVKENVKQSELKEYGYPHYIFNKDWNGYLQFDPEGKQISDFIIGYKVSYSDEKPVFEEPVKYNLNLGETTTPTDKLERATELIHKLENTELKFDSFGKYYLEIVDLRKLSDSYEVYSQDM